MITSKETQTIANAINILLREVKSEYGELINPILDFAKNLNTNVDVNISLDTTDNIKTEPVISVKKNGVGPYVSTMDKCKNGWKPVERDYVDDASGGPCTKWDENKYWCKCYAYLKAHPYSTRKEVHNAVSFWPMSSSSDHSTSWRSMLRAGVVKQWRNGNKIAYTVGKKL